MTILGIFMDTHLYMDTLSHISVKFIYSLHSILRTLIYVLWYITFEKLNACTLRNKIQAYVKYTSNLQTIYIKIYDIYIRNMPIFFYKSPHFEFLWILRKDMKLSVESEKHFQKIIYLKLYQDIANIRE